jgi:hypothetical protein
MSASPVRMVYGLQQIISQAEPPQVLSLPIRARHAWAVYAKYGYACYVAERITDLFKKPSLGCPSNDEWLYRSARLIWFVDTANILPTDLSMPIQFRTIPLPHGAGKVTCLTDSKGTPFILSETYDNPQRYASALQQLGVASITVPSQLAPYNGGDRKNPGTTSFLLTHPTFQSDLDRIRDKLTAPTLRCPFQEDGHHTMPWQDAEEFLRDEGFKF